MTIKKYLNKLDNLDKEITSLEEQIIVVRSRRENMTLQLKEKVQSSGSSVNNLCELTIELLELEEKLTNKLLHKVKMQGKVSDILMLLDNNVQSAVLRSRYILKKPWEQISSEYNYSEGRIYQIHNAALKAAEKICVRKN